MSDYVRMLQAEKARQKREGTMRLATPAENAAAKKPVNPKVGPPSGVKGTFFQSGSHGGGGGGG